MQALVKASPDPQQRARTNYRISGPCFTTVQFAVDALMNDPGVEHAEFDLPRRDRQTREYVATGYADARLA